MNARRAFPSFRAGASLDRVAKETGRSMGTVCGYLCDYIRTEKPASVSRHGSTTSDTEQIAAAVAQHGMERLKPIFVALGENAFVRRHSHRRREHESGR